VATLTVTKFNTAVGASEALDTLERLQQEQLITIVDAAIVEWYEDAKKPKMRQMHHLVATGALGGAFWGLLFGLIFLVPILGLAVGAATGAGVGSLRDYGIDDDFVREAREQITPGTSALFLMSTGAVLDRVIEEFKDTDMEIISTNLSREDEEQLRELFGEAPPPHEAPQDSPQEAAADAQQEPEES
jgi:uncharacterized membrane protein